jgi:hypothetical protein
MSAEKPGFTPEEAKTITSEEIDNVQADSVEINQEYPIKAGDFAQYTSPSGKLSKPMEVERIEARTLRIGQKNHTAVHRQPRYKKSVFVHFKGEHVAHLIETVSLFKQPASQETSSDAIVQQSEVVESEPTAETTLPDIGYEEHGTDVSKPQENPETIPAGTLEQAEVPITLKRLASEIPKQETVDNQKNSRITGEKDKKESSEKKETREQIGIFSQAEIEEIGNIFSQNFKQHAKTGQETFQQNFPVVDGMVKLHPDGPLYPQSEILRLFKEINSSHKKINVYGSLDDNGSEFTFKVRASSVDKELDKSGTSFENSNGDGKSPSKKPDVVNESAKKPFENTNIPTVFEQKAPKTPNDKSEDGDTTTGDSAAKDKTESNEKKETPEQIGIFSQTEIEEIGTVLVESFSKHSSTSQEKFEQNFLVKDGMIRLINGGPLYAESEIRRLFKEINATFRQIEISGSFNYDNTEFTFRVQAANIEQPDNKSGRFTVGDEVYWGSKKTVINAFSYDKKLAMLDGVSGYGVPLENLKFVHERERDVGSDKGKTRKTPEQPPDPVQSTETSPESGPVRDVKDPESKKRPADKKRTIIDRIGDWGRETASKMEVRTIESLKVWYQNLWFDKHNAASAKISDTLKQVTFRKNDLLKKQQEHDRILKNMESLGSAAIVAAPEARKEREAFRKDISKLEESERLLQAKLDDRHSKQNKYEKKRNDIADRVVRRFEGFSKPYQERIAGLEIDRSNLALAVFEFDVKVKEFEVTESALKEKLTIAKYDSEKVTFNIALGEIRKKLDVCRKELIDRKNVLNEVDQSLRKARVPLEKFARIQSTFKSAKKNFRREDVDAAPTYGNSKNTRMNSEEVPYEVPISGDNQPTSNTETRRIRVETTLENWTRLWNRSFRNKQEIDSIGFGEFLQQSNTDTSEVSNAVVFTRLAQAYLNLKRTVDSSVSSRKKLAKDFEAFIEINEYKYTT